MCGLFGFINYASKLDNWDLSKICNALARESEERGSHATGISYINKGKLITEKAPKPAHKMNFRLPRTIAVMGHTRHTTQGNEKKNINNHPFVGYSNAHKPFALAHNGILYNDRDLRVKHMLPKTKIETDSYIAVQLIEQKGTVNLDSLRYMAEQVQGSFSFTILDHVGNLYFAKGDSPISVLHFKELGFYIYASTDDILWRAMANTVLIQHLQKALEGKIETVHRVPIKDGEIVKIDTKGAITKTTFRYDEYGSIGFNWWDAGINPSKRAAHDDDFYMEQLKSVAAQLGYNPDEIDSLIECGYSYQEIEELIYERDFAEDDYGALCYHLCGK